MSKKDQPIIVGLDIGTTKVVAIAGRKNEFGKLEILGYGKAESAGVSHGPGPGRPRLPAVAEDGDGDGGGAGRPALPGEAGEGVLVGRDPVHGEVGGQLVEVGAGVHVSLVRPKEVHG